MRPIAPDPAPRLRFLLTRASALPGAWVGDKPEWDTVVASVGRRLFTLVLTHSDGRTLVNVKLEPDDVRAVVQQFTWVEPGFHQSKRHWVSLDLTSREYDAATATELVKESYTIVLGLLPRSHREAVLLAHAAGTPPHPTWQW